MLKKSKYLLFGCLLTAAIALVIACGKGEIDPFEDIQMDYFDALENLELMLDNCYDPVSYSKLTEAMQKNCDAMKNWADDPPEESSSSEDTPVTQSSSSDDQPPPESSSSAQTTQSSSAQTTQQSSSSLAPSSSSSVPSSSSSVPSSSSSEPSSSSSVPSSSSDNSGGGSSSEDNSGGSSSSYTLACGNVPTAGTVGTAITKPSVTCNSAAVTGTITWAPSTLDWSNPAAGTYNNITATADCGGSKTANCSGTLTVTDNSGGGGEGNSVKIITTDNNSGPQLENSTYTVSEIGSCTNVRFNCAWVAENNGPGCSINSIEGGHNSPNNILPNVSVGTTLVVIGKVSNIWCASW